METPIQSGKLNKKSKDFLVSAERLTGYSDIKKIYAKKSVFANLFDSIDSYLKPRYKNQIPFNNKLIVPIPDDL